MTITTFNLETELPHYNLESANFTALEGRTLTQIDLAYDFTMVCFHTTDSQLFIMHHDQDCCEDVWLEDINGDLEDLIGTPVIKAEVLKQENNGGIPDSTSNVDSYTWTFYKLATKRGEVTLRWFGESNGYYSEEVDFEKTVSRQQPVMPKPKTGLDVEEHARRISWSARICRQISMDIESEFTQAKLQKYNRAKNVFDYFVRKADMQGFKLVDYADIRH